MSDGSGYGPTCFGCGNVSTLGTVELDFTDDVRRTISVCDACRTEEGLPNMHAVIEAFKQFGAMPLNPNATPRVCPFCGGADERKCGCV